MSKILNSRLVQILPKIISTNQSGFIKGQHISENIMLGQEIMSNIQKANKWNNVAMKLGIAKAYDRVT